MKRLMNEKKERKVLHYVWIDGIEEKGEEKKLFLLFELAKVNKREGK